MATLTPEVARDLMHRSMTTGVPITEMNQYGGRDAVAKVYEQSGGAYSRSEIAPSKLKEYTQQVLDQGYGNYGSLKETNMRLTPESIAALARKGASNETIARLTEKYGIGGNSGADWQNSFNELQSQYGTLQDQLAQLQSQYDELVSQYNRQGDLSSGGIVGGNLVDDGSSLNPGQTGAGGSNLGNTGKVYGPDGKEYSSAAAAIAAGVTNFTSSPPQLGPGLIAGADTLNNQFLQPPANTGSANPGANIANQNQQLFEMGAPKVKLPGNIANPFSV